MSVSIRVYDLTFTSAGISRLLRKHFSVVMDATQLELKGIPLSHILKDCRIRNKLYDSRSFGRVINYRVNNSLHV